MIMKTRPRGGHRKKGPVPGCELFTEKPQLTNLSFQLPTVIESPSEILNSVTTYPL